MQTLTQALTAWGNRPLLAPWVLVGLARVWKWRSNFWETEVNICLCFLAISHKNSFCGRDLSGQTVAKARHELPNALQGKVGLFPAEINYQPASGPRLAQWAGHRQASAVACRCALETILIEGSGRGQWPRPALSLHNSSEGFGDNAGPSLHGSCQQTRVLQQAWWSLLHLLLTLEPGNVAQESWVLPFHASMFDIYRQKNSLRATFHYLLQRGGVFCGQNISALNSIELFLLSTPWVGEAQWLEETMCGNFVSCWKQ